MKAIHLVFAAMVLTLPCCTHHKKEGEAHPAKVEVAYPVVDSVTLSKTYPGTLRAQKQVQLVARVNGYLQSKNYTSGDYVRKGEVLFTIESSNYRDAVERARSAVASTEAQLEYAQSRYQALTEAFKTDAVSRMEVEQGRSTLENCRSTLASARASLKTAQTQLSYCTVRAPFDGHVTLSKYDQGAYLSGEAQPAVLAEIFEDNVMLADFAIDDASAMFKLQQNIAAGAVDFNQIPLMFSDTLQHSYTASLDYLSPQVNTSTGTVQLQARVANPHGELRSGMFVSVDLPVGNDPKAVLVKDAAIGADQLGKYVYVVNDSDKVVYTPIQTGAAVNDTMRIVKSGITPHSRYVTKALLKVRDGMAVKPVVEK